MSKLSAGIIITLPCGDKIMDNPCFDCQHKKATDQCMGAYQGCTHMACGNRGIGCNNEDCPYGVY